MSVVDTAKTAYDLAKKGLTVEFQEKIMQLREEALELQEENLRLKKDNGELRERVELQETVAFRRRVYWRDGDDVPFCQYCRETSHVLIHLAGGQGTDADGKRHYRCPECETYYRVPGEGDFIMDTFRRDHKRGHDR
jgi:hypothetical protein